MPSNPELELRGRLVRNLGQLRDMLPGSFVVRYRKCGKANCRCAQGKVLHAQFQLSMLLAGKRKTFHIPAELAEDARRGVEMHKRFQQLASRICQLNLRRFLRRKEKPSEQEPD
ncbi:MAG TPA: DUF6788 family protein [Candidatus Acidoferrum sp.]|nr:DUF6788 family protein [Candidatus Acidoferrum sp.]